MTGRGSDQRGAAKGSLRPPVVRLPTMGPAAHNPGLAAPTAAEIRRALDLVAATETVAVLTGAGMSTDSGIPDYRGPTSPQATPMLYEEFVTSAENRRRYWARAFKGWARMGQAHPNAAHEVLARLETHGRLTGVITQNVDGLHEAAGSGNLIALHGRIADVVCLGCAAVTSREAFQDELARLNPEAALDPEAGHAELRPDGDAVVSDWQGFVFPDCPSCGGILKPDVVFFGESVPKDRVQACFDIVDNADLLLVLGSSLTVMSGLRFVHRAVKLRRPVVIVNRGETRGDPLATIKLNLGVAEFLTAMEAHTVTV
ncbi:MAG: NAD-dependent protein deacetylase [Propionibacteriaceae bacterium]|nr:NAD-dependent protein deacetylase [Propionibacteriaceae bacterium]